ncbi:hypothetical protein FA13DRAFT_815587 [Coprinellus micaceus]|uniref:Uncharacterized protein n=1 Tax=Coprinellus micaceus TaxID=71717 RepID=A0A4Y7T1Z9_COPMI|nr:hypothetical protein FA13DRAFT_815587 [Coprinellus micaceus]
MTVAERTMRIVGCGEGDEKELRRGNHALPSWLSAYSRVVPIIYVNFSSRVYHHRREASGETCLCLCVKLLLRSPSSLPSPICHGFRSERSASLTVGCVARSGILPSFSTRPPAFLPLARDKLVLLPSISSIPPACLPPSPLYDFETSSAYPLCGHRSPFAFSPSARVSYSFVCRVFADILRTIPHPV